MIHAFSAAAAGGAESVERVDNAESPATKPTPPFKMARRFGRHSIGSTIFPSDVGSETAWQMILRGGNVGEEFESRRTGWPRQCVVGKILHCAQDDGVEAKPAASR